MRISSLKCQPVVVDGVVVFARNEVNGVNEVEVGNEVYVGNEVEVGEEEEAVQHTLLPRLLQITSWRVKVQTMVNLMHTIQQMRL